MLLIDEIGQGLVAFAVRTLAEHIEGFMQQDNFLGLTQKCSSKAKRRRQYTEYGEALERRWGGFA
ncbi:MAG: hypothetical protein B7Y40_07300 [Gammaproteobacteria bacterium 28-57-27]|nr:MAG: hypothetical protein B7Y40_07300 [Gammaproteobacteria bacterium 28-57-27]